MYEIVPTPVIGFYSMPNAVGNTFTLTTLLGELLHELERRFGSRDLEYTILGIEFGSGVPCVWFPGNRKHIAVRLSDGACTNSSEAFFELAHEAVHLLAPTLNASVIEEGLAVLFSHEKKDGPYGHGISARWKDYLYCESRLKELLSICPDAIRRLREIEPSFSAMTPAMIKSLDPRISDELAESLCTLKADLKLG